MTIALSNMVSAADDYDWTNYYQQNADAAAFMGLGLVVCAVICIIWFVVWILVAIWVYKDAEKRGKSGVIWLLIVILTGIIGLIIWLVVRGEKSQGPARMCPSCGRSIPEDARVCPYCNKKFDQP
ncbi:MAG: zinc ribbon domain-containing protein [Candidatus Thermoplasmatota archaeon]